MGDRPWLRFWTSDWLGSMKRRSMTLSETGAYINLLCTAWESGDYGLPDDDLKLAKLSDANGEWDSVREAVRGCFFEKGGRLYNQKLLDQAAYEEKQRENGRKGGIEKAKRWRNSSEHPSQNVAKVVPPLPLPLPLPVPDPDPKVKRKTLVRQTPPNVHVSEIGFQEFWLAYPPRRKTKKAACLKKWVAKKCSENTIAVMQGLAHCKASADWQKADNDGPGAFVPAPLVWLGNECWTDQMAPANGNGGRRERVVTATDGSTMELG